MLNSKQRAYLRGLANTIPALFQIGKEGISENNIRAINDYLEAKELLKIHVLDNALSDVRELSNEVASLTESDVVQVIGSKFILYKESVENKTIVLPK